MEQKYFVQGTGKFSPFRQMHAELLLKGEISEILYADCFCFVLFCFSPGRRSANIRAYPHIMERF